MRNVAAAVDRLELELLDPTMIAACWRD